MANAHERIIYDTQGNPVTASVYRYEIKRPPLVQAIFNRNHKSDIEIPVVTIDEEGRTFKLSHLRSGAGMENNPPVQYKVYLGMKNTNGTSGYYIYPENHPKGSVAEEFGKKGIITRGDFFQYSHSDPLITIGKQFTFQVLPLAPQLMYPSRDVIVFVSDFEPETIVIDEVTAIEISPFFA